MTLRQGIADLTSQINRFFDWQSPCLAPIQKAPTVDVLHHQKRTV